MCVEFTALQNKNTWIKVLRSKAEKDGKSFIPIAQVFKYKFDDQGFLIKYKTKLCTCRDLQKTKEDTYVATLAAQIFRALMAIITVFDLET